MHAGQAALATADREAGSDVGDRMNAREQLSWLEMDTPSTLPPRPPRSLQRFTGSGAVLAWCPAHRGSWGHGLSRPPLRGEQSPGQWVASQAQGKVGSWRSPLKHARQVKVKVGRHMCPGAAHRSQPRRTLCLPLSRGGEPPS